MKLKCYCNSDSATYKEMLLTWENVDRKKVQDPAIPVSKCSEKDEEKHPEVYSFDSRK